MSFGNAAEHERLGSKASPRMELQSGFVVVGHPASAMSIDTAAALKEAALSWPMLTQNYHAWRCNVAPQ